MIAVDVGNARTKFGWFSGPRSGPLPEPQQNLEADNHAGGFRDLGTWLQSFGQADHPQGVQWWIGSVNRPACTQLLNWLRDHRPHEPVTLLTAGDLPLKVKLERPDMVGVDRLLDAVAANQLRRPGRPAAVVDVGTAITVDLLSAAGEFLGGSILPGIAMSAQALHEMTDLLPRLEISQLSTPPPALGTSTVDAMRSGLFWGAVGAIRQLVQQLGTSGGAQLDVLLTGGAAPAVAELLGPSARYVPHLTLAGIALTAEKGLTFSA